MSLFYNDLPTRCCGTTGMEDAVEAAEALFVVVLDGEELDEAVLAEPLA